MKINRSTVYYKSNVNKADKDKKHKEELDSVMEVFNENRKEYGCRKIKNELKKKNIIFSKRKICALMKELGIKSSYEKSTFKPENFRNCNESDVPNLLGRQFDCWSRNEVIVSDLTYVKVNGKWNYICILIDLFNREIVGWSVGNHKTSELVKWAFDNSELDFDKILIFHTDRGMEFKNEMIDSFLDKHGIIRSLSRKGSPRDNAVSESTYHIIKTEFVKGRNFESLEMLKLEFGDYVHWFNNCRCHGSLNYMTPMEYRNAALKKTA